MRSPAVAVVLVSTLISAGCATTDFRPTAPGRAALIMPEYGQEWVVRDGQLYSTSPFGSELEQAVAGVPEAEAYAHGYQTKSLIGQGLSLVGAGLGVAGVFAADWNQGLDDGDNTLALGLFIGSIVSSIAAGSFTMAARTDLLDAINVYNDRAVDSPARAALPPVSRR